MILLLTDVRLELFSTYNHSILLTPFHASLKTIKECTEEEKSLNETVYKRCRIVVCLNFSNHHHTRTQGSNHSLKVSSWSDC